MENKCCGEEKVGCCESKDGSIACCHGMSNCCKNWKKCHMMKKLIVLVLLIVAFCLGTQWGEMKGERRSDRFERGGMMNWGYGKFDNKLNSPLGATGSVTVEVTKPALETTPKQ